MRTFSACMLAPKPKLHRASASRSGLLAQTRMLKQVDICIRNYVRGHGGSVKDEHVNELAQEVARIIGDKTRDQSRAKQIVVEWIQRNSPDATAATRHP